MNKLHFCLGELITQARQPKKGLCCFMMEDVGIENYNLFLKPLQYLRM